MENNIKIIKIGNYFKDAIRVIILTLIMTLIMIKDLIKLYVLI